MVKIDNLEVRFDVEGEGDEVVFARYFQKYVQRWASLQQQQHSQQQLVDSDRTLGDRAAGGDT